MFGYKTVMETMETKIKQLTDPTKTIPSTDSNGDPILDDEGNPVLIPDPTPIFADVGIGKPSRISFFDGPAAILVFANVPNLSFKGMGGQMRRVTIQGAVLTFIPGNDRDALLTCLHYSDIVGDFFEKKSNLELAGAIIEPLTSNSQGWRVIDVNKFFNNRSTSQLVPNTTGTSIFQITKAKEKS